VRLRRAIYASPRSGDNLNAIFAPQEHSSATIVSVTCGSLSPGWHCPVLGDEDVEGSVGVQTSPPKRAGAHVGVLAELEAFALTRGPTSSCPCP
jgi:hypothetical protein